MPASKRDESREMYIRETESKGQIPTNNASRIQKMGIGKLNTVWIF
jgi:hypothetical protein